MLRSFSFPGCLMMFNGCFLFSRLVSRSGLVAISQIIPDNQNRLTQAPSTQSQLAVKTNFDESSSLLFQESVVGKVSNEKIPLDKRAEELNIHLDVPAKYLKNKNISAERLVNRMRRNTNDREVFDEDEIETLTDIALQQCPYNTFCHRNRTHAPEFMSGFGSCCKDCFCDEQCGERMDCCWEFLDTRKIEETNKLSCITPVVLSENEQLEDEPSYLMIDFCHGNDSYKCSRENAAIWGPLYPAFSSTTSMIYYNRNCASCNGVTDPIPWDTNVSCNGTNSLNGLSLLNGLKRKRCRVGFRPPKKAISEKFACHPEIINTCTRGATEGGFQNNNDLRKACRRTKGYVKANNPNGTGTVTYANIFCKLCNGHSHSPDKQCRFSGESTKASFSAKVTTLIDWEVLDSATNEATVTNGIRQTQDICRENEVRHPTKGSNSLQKYKNGFQKVNYDPWSHFYYRRANKEDCRDLICPNGAIRTPDGCKLFAKTWHVSGYEIHVIMTPVSELFIPLTEFNNLTERVHNINDWLDTKGLDINHLIMYAEETEMDNKTLLGAMNMRLGSDKYPLNAQEMLKTIETSVSKEWSITLNKIVYPYKVQFDKYETFVQTGSVNKDKWYGEDPSPSSAMAESFMLPKVYTLVLYIRRMTGLNINKMFYCEKIELLENEWSGAFDGIWLNVTGSGNDTFFGDGEFFYEKDVFGTKVVTVQICLDDFMSQFVSDKNTAPSLDHSIYVFLYLELVFIFA